MTDAAAVLGSLGVLLALLSRSRGGLLGGLVAIAAAEVLLARELVPGSLASTLASAAGVAMLLVGLPALLGLAALLVRFPGAVPPLVVGAAPFRFPFEIGSENRFFVGLADSGALGRLLPLYAVVAAAALALAWRAARGAAPRPLPWPLGLPVALFVALTTISLLWAYDRAAADDRLTFFVLPFAALLAVVARAPFRPWLPRVLAIEAVALACLFAAVGIGEAWTRTLLFYDPKIAVANEFTSYFRVTSLFSDPSMYARHLVLAMAIVVCLLWAARVGLVVGGLVLAFLWVGLLFSYSQSSMAALAAAVVVVTFLVAHRGARRMMAAVAAVLVVAGAVALVTLLRDESAARVTSGRSTLVTDTWTVFANHPVAGVGVGSQPAASADETDGPPNPARHVSHTAPLTVGAELGIVGLALYAAFLAGLVWTVRAVRRRDDALGLALVAVAVVLVVHSLVYAVFFEDPILWSALGVAAAFLATPAPASEPAAARTATPQGSPRPLPASR
jgi:O-antigen ligase